MGFDAYVEVAQQGLPAKRQEQALVDFFAAHSGAVSRRIGRRIDLAAQKPYTGTHNAGYTECQEFYGAITLESDEPLGHQIVTMLAVALRGIGDRWHDVVIPGLDFVVVENTLGKFCATPDNGQLTIWSEPMKLTFCGAARTVTGTQHLLEVNGHRILLDCGLYQGPRDEARRRNSHFHYKPSDVECVVLSHAHMDHVGNLPTLVAAGYDGPVYCTPGTADVAAVMLQDSARIQQEDTEFLNKHKRRRGEPLIKPLYGLEDVERTARLVHSREYFKPFAPVPGIQVTFWDAGHVLGSAIVQIDIEHEAGSGQPRRFVFSGDLGRRKLPILRDPMTLRDIDVLVCESTYGNRVHDETGAMKEELAGIVSKVVQRRGKVIIPAFSLGRTQNVVYFMNQLFQEGRLPRVPIYVDSPLSVKLTETYRGHEECFDADTWRIMRDDPDVFGFFGLQYVSAAADSRKLNDQEGPFVVIASSGMCEAGRVLHHLRYSVSDRKNAVLIVGFQAPGTLGRRIADRTPRLRIMDDWFDLRAEVYQLDGLSAHADRNDFQWWFEATGGNIGHAFLVHGEPESMTALAPLLQPFVKNPVQMPALYESATM